MKFFKRALIIIFLNILLIYVTSITSIPKSIILFQGEKLDIDTIFGVNINQRSNEYEAVQASINPESEVSSNIGKIDLSVNLGSIKIKDVTVNVIPKTVVVPVGNTIGLKLYTSGVLVVGMSEIEGEDKNKHKPYQNTGIIEGDMIVEINKKTVSCTADLIQTVNESNGEDISVKYVRDGDVKTTNMSPAKTSSNEYKLGLWVRDAAAGVGTVSFYEPSTGMFAALGHGILDIDTEKLINISKGEVVTSNILSITKGEKGKPGEIKGSIENGQTVGEVYKNSSFGIYGKINNPNILGINIKNELEIMPRNEIKKGSASIICTLENNSKEEYEIEIEKVFTNNNLDNKSMLIKVKDKKLIEKTGGIIQGMSGSPIIQDGKFVGAVTHVLVNDPTMGYGVFADLMIKQIREVE